MKIMLMQGSPHQQTELAEKIDLAKLVCELEVCYL